MWLKKTTEVVIGLMATLSLVACGSNNAHGTAAAFRLCGFRPRAEAGWRAVLRSFGIGDTLWRPLADIPAP
jgi:hypothetical protein